MTDETQPSESPDDQSSESSDAQKNSAPRGPRVFGRFAFWIVAMPFIFYLFGSMIGGYVENLRESKIRGTLDDLHHGESGFPIDEVPLSELEKEVDPNDKFLGVLPLNKNAYPYTYIATIAGTTLLMLLFGWGYFRAPFRISFLSFVVGVVGVVIWIALAEFDRNFLHLSDWMFGLIPPREAFEPLKELKGDPTWMWQFIAIRFFGLVIVVPVTEEFFVRGFLMRYVEDPDWDELPLGTTQKPWIWAIPTAYGVFAHMTEPLSALVWFSMVTWLYKRTGSIWDCVIAHSITNLLLGIYIFKFDAWYLW